MPKVSRNNSNKRALKDAIIFCLTMGGNHLSARNIQSLLGLKKQTTYNYLKELEKEGVVKSEFEAHGHREHLLVGYYSLTNSPPIASKATIPDSRPTLSPDSHAHITNLFAKIKHKHKRSGVVGVEIDTIRQHIQTQLNFSIAGIRIIKTFLDGIDNEVLFQLLGEDFPDILADPDKFMLTHREYGIMLQQIFELNAQN